MKGSIVTTSLFILLVAFTGLAWGHGTQHHQESSRMISHMEQMQQLKQQIPEEFRIMNRTPLIPDDQSLQQGAALFGRFCVVCHGQDGRGDGPTANNLDPAPADFLDLDHSAIYGPGEKYWIIGNGSGKTGMPGFEQELTPRDRWDLINHIYRLQGAKY
jgi:mono/diheme cytochrome c family protein